MTNISKEGWIGIGATIVIVVIGVGSKLFEKKNPKCLNWWFQQIIKIY